MRFWERLVMLLERLVVAYEVSTLLEILAKYAVFVKDMVHINKFQPFLRFWTLWIRSKGPEKQYSFNPS